MKSQIIILKVDYEDDDDKPNTWCWNHLIGCKNCVELLNYSVINEQDEKVQS